jgi:hypothetical protein
VWALLGGPGGAWSLDPMAFSLEGGSRGSETRHFALAYLAIHYRKIMNLYVPSCPSHRFCLDVGYMCDDYAENRTRDLPINQLPLESTISTTTYCIILGAMIGATMPRIEPVTTLFVCQDYVIRLAPPYSCVRIT